LLDSRKALFDVLLPLQQRRDGAADDIQALLVGHQSLHCSIGKSIVAAR
jgi:hypothetical protein